MTLRQRKPPKTKAEPSINKKPQTHQKSPTIHDVTEGEWETLGARVGRASGRLIIVVHPYYHRRIPAGNGAESNKQKEYEMAVDNLLKSPDAPVLILEEHGRIKKTRDRLNALRSSNPEMPNHPIVPTLSNRPEGILRWGEGDRIRYVVPDEGLGMLIERLEKAGVEEVDIAGMEVHLSNDSRAGDIADRGYTKNDLHTRSPGCAGRVCMHLTDSGRFRRVSILPKASYPLKPLREQTIP